MANDGFGWGKKSYDYENAAVVNALLFRVVACMRAHKHLKTHSRMSIHFICMNQTINDNSGNGNSKW